MTLSTAQPNKGFKTVPDSLTCITPTQVEIHVQDRYVLNGQAISLILEAKSIESLNMAIDKLKDQVVQKDEEAKLRVLQNDNWQADYKYLNQENVKLNSKTKFQKVVIYILGGLAISELGYIGVRRVIP